MIREFKISTVRGFSYGLMAGSIIPGAICVGYSFYNLMPMTAIVCWGAGGTTAAVGAGIAIANALRGLDEPKRNYSKRPDSPRS